MAAQTDAGRILGDVHDQTGGIVVGAVVAIEDLQKNLSRTVITGESGEYNAPDLPPGTYRVRAAATGFKGVDRSAIQLEVAKDVRIDFVLEPGEVQETITVTGDAPLVETTNDVLGGTLSNRAINELPLNGRDFQNLLVLQPGVTRYPGGGIGSVSANGIRPEDNNYIVDGVDNNDAYYGQSIANGAGVQGTPATILPIDAIQEFNVQENPPAEFGWKPGAIVNVALKSGSNAPHGTAYYFGRNALLDARNLFNTEPSPKKPLRLQQPGGTLGGPVLHDKLFFFVAYEGVRDVVGVTQAVPSPASVHLPTPPTPTCTYIASGDCGGSIPDAVADLRAGGFPISALSSKLASLFPANSGTGPQGPTTITTGFPNTNRGDNGLLKIDYHRDDRDLFSGTWFIGDSLQREQDAPVLQSAWKSEATTRAQVVGANWVRVSSPQLVSTTRLGYNRLSQSLLTEDAGVNPAVYGINTGVTDPLNFGMPQILVAGFLSMGGTSGWPQLVTPAETYQLIQNFSYTHGRHALKFGGEVRRSSVNHAKDRFGKGRIRFGFNNDDIFPGATALEDFLSGTPSDGRIFVGNSRRQVSFWSYSSFVQDDWRISSRVTVNLGLRYELNTVLKEAHDLLGNFDPNLGLVQVGRQIPSPYNGDHNNFAPRTGFSWDVTGHSKTVIRAGGGMAYEIPHMDVFIGQFNLNNDPGTIGINIIPTGAVPGGGTIDAGIKYVSGAALNWSAAGPVFDTTTMTCSAAAPCDILGVNRNLRTPYVASWNVNVQHGLTGHLSVEAGYVGNHGTKLYGITDINQILNQSPAELACNHCEDNSDRPFGVRFPYLGFINQISNSDHSNYSGLQATLTERSYHGVSFLAGYTWSHSLDDASDNRAPQAMDSTRPWLEYGSSDFDVRHRLTFALTWDLPGRPAPGQLLRGWQINSIVTLQGGLPWNVVDTGMDFSGTAEGSDRWDFFGNPADFRPSSNGPIPFFAGASNPACAARATTAAMLAALQSFGCYQQGNSVMLPPASGTFGTMGRNIFRGPGLYNLDLSLVKHWNIGEGLQAQLRGEFFNVFNHPSLASPYGANATFFQVDPSVPGSFGCACATPDVAEANPVIGSGGPRNIQLGVKLIF
jgi:carboxypeptidase family protein